MDEADDSALKRLVGHRSRIDPVTSGDLLLTGLLAGLLTGLLTSLLAGARQVSYAVKPTPS
jgi:sugar/nucleoside kinase (ribokinase family)